jgi:hypothetical protein
MPRRGAYETPHWAQNLVEAARARPGERAVVLVDEPLVEEGSELAAALRDGRHAVVVGHFWSNQLLLGCLQGMPFDAIVDTTSYRPGNGSVLEVLCPATGDGVSVSRAAPRGEGGVS